MRKRQALIIRILLGWWIFCLAGPCLALPLQESLTTESFAERPLTQDVRSGSHCAADEVGCENEAFVPILLLAFAGALPILFSFGVLALRPLYAAFPEAVPFSGEGPPVYRLSQRIRE